MLAEWRFARRLAADDPNLNQYEARRVLSRWFLRMVLFNTIQAGIALALAFPRVA